MKESEFNFSNLDTMKKSLYALMLVIIVGLPLLSNAEEIPKNIFLVKSSCDILYPEKERSLKDNYKKGYDNCFKIFKDYNDLLNASYASWQLSKESLKIEDFENTKISFKKLYIYLNEYGVGLTNTYGKYDTDGVFDSSANFIVKDKLLKKIDSNLFEIDNTINSLKSIETEKNTTAQKATNNMAIEQRNKLMNSGKIELSTGSVINNIKITTCNPGFTVIPKTGKCRKLPKKKISSVVK